MQIKTLALLAIFLALPAMAQAPSDPVKDFMAEYGRQALTIKQQESKLICLSGVLTKGDEMAKAVLDFKAKPIATETGTTTSHAMFQAAEDYQRVEKACLQKQAQ